jgi:hypothetical protein
MIPSKGKENKNGGKYKGRKDLLKIHKREELCKGDIRV